MTKGRKVESIILRVLIFAAAATFAVLLFLLAYILINGLPNIKPSLFSLEYNTENASLMPALVNTVIMTALSLVIAIPFGIFSAIFLVEYAKKGNKFVGIIRITAETLSGIPSIVYGLFGMLFFVSALKWGYSILAGAFTMSIMILPLIMRTTEEALKSVPTGKEVLDLGRESFVRFSGLCFQRRCRELWRELSWQSEESWVRQRP